MGGSIDLERKGCDAGPTMQPWTCNMGLSVCYSTYRIHWPRNGLMQNCYSFQIVSPLMGCPFSDLWAEGCCHSLNALSTVFLSSYLHEISGVFAIDTKAWCMMAVSDCFCFPPSKYSAKNIPKYDYFSPFFFHSFKTVCTEQLNRGAKLDILALFPKVPVITAVVSGSTQPADMSAVVKEFQETKDCVLQSPLIFSITMHDFPACKFLLKKGARVNFTDQNQMTPLMRAVQRVRMKQGVYTGLILGLHPANERQRYFVTTSLIGWA